MPVPARGTSFELEKRTQRNLVSIKRRKFMDNLSLWRYKHIDKQGGNLKVDEKVN